MFLVLLIAEAFGCLSYVQDLNIFPTVGEYYELGMDQLFYNGCDQFKCSGCGNGISVNNAVEILYSQSLNYTFSNVIWNLTHFAGLTDSSLVIYLNDKNAQEINEVFQISIPINYTCLNLVFVNNQSTIMLDCYLQDALYFFQLLDQQFQQVYDYKGRCPLKSKFQLFKNLNQEYILYAQYYEEESILTLLSEQDNQYINQSIYNCTEFQDFISTPNFIYIQKYSQILQISLSNSKFQCEQYLHYQFNSNIVTFSAYYSVKNQAECDKLIVLTEEQNYFQILFGCNDSLIVINSSNAITSLNNQSNVQLFINDDFILALTNQTELFVFQNDISYPLLQIIEFKNPNNLILDIFQNYLYTFGSEFNFCLIQTPQLTVNYDQVDEKIIQIQAISSLENFTNSFGNINISIQILNIDDNNVYLQYQPNSSTNYIVYQFIQTINYYSGKLLNITPNYYYSQNNSFGSFSDSTLTATRQLKFSGQIQLLSKFEFSTSSNSAYYYSVYSNYNLLYFQQCEYQYCTNLANQSLSQSLMNLQLGYNYKNKIIAGIQINETFIQCLFLNSNNLISAQLNITVGESIVQYIISYNSAIVLTNDLIIIFYNCQQEQNITINQEFINEQFNQNQNYTFNPINITQNIQYLSSILFINNLTNIIAVSILNDMKIIPISKIEMNQTIYGINLVGQRLILSFFNNETLSFQVWNYNDIFEPYFEKNLTQIMLSNLISITNDNLFLYVIFNQTSLYIYNPNLSQHMALFKNLTVQNTQIASTQISKTQSMLYFNNLFYQMNNMHQFMFNLDTTQKEFDEYPQLFYNFSIQSLYENNQTSQTLSQLLVFLNNFTTIEPRQFEVNLTEIEFMNNQFSFIIPKDLTAQMGSCEQDIQYTFNVQYKLKDKINCSNLTNIYEEQQDNFNNSLVIFYNESLMLQNQNYLQFYDYQLYQYMEIIVNYTNLSFSQCLISVQSYQSLYSICQNYTGYYWIQFDIINNSYSIPYQINIPAQPIKINSQGFILLNTSDLFYCNSSQCINVLNNCTDFAQTSVYFLGNQFILLLFIKENKAFYIFQNPIIKQQESQELYVQAVDDSQINLLEILIINQKNYRLILFFRTDSTQNYFLTYAINFSENKIIFKNILRLQPQIPQYYQNTQNSKFYSISSVVVNNLLILYYYYSFSFYNLSDLINENERMKPVLMIGQMNMHLTQGQQFTVSYNTSSEIVTIFSIQNAYMAGLGQNLMGKVTCEPAIKSAFILFSCRNGIGDANLQIHIVNEPQIIYNLILVSLITLSLFLYIIIRILGQTQTYQIITEIQVDL